MVEGWEMPIIISILFSVFWATRSLSIPSGMYTSLGSPSDLNTLIASVKPGMVVLVGEKHGQKPVQDFQLELLERLRERGFIVSLGMEFISYRHQDALDQYRGGLISDEEFINLAEFGPKLFPFYKQQIQFPRREKGEQVVGINAERSITSKIAKLGLQGLTQEELAQLPPNFKLGRDSYKKRFSLAMNHAVGAESLERYFQAQSVWDDTMAWRISEEKSKGPQDVLVIIVGDFHVQYGGGLTDRLLDRGVKNILTVSQIDQTDFDSSEIIQAIEPSIEFGPRADYIWIY